MGATWEPEILNEGYQSKLTFPPIKSSNVKAEILLIKTYGPVLSSPLLLLLHRT